MPGWFVPMIPVSPFTQPSVSVSVSAQLQTRQAIREVRARSARSERQTGASCYRHWDREVPGPSDLRGVLAGLPHTTGRSASKQGTPTGGSWYAPLIFQSSQGFADRTYRSAPAPLSRCQVAVFPALKLPALGSPARQRGPPGSVRGARRREPARSHGVDRSTARRSGRVGARLVRRA